MASERVKKRTKKTSVPRNVREKSKIFFVKRTRTSENKAHERERQRDGCTMRMRMRETMCRLKGLDVH